MPNPVYIERNGVDISASVDWSSLDYLGVLTKEVSTLRFNVKIGIGQTTPVKSVPAEGDRIDLYDSSGHLFGGTVTDRQVSVEGLLLTYQITCTDWSYLLDGELVVKTYAEQDPRDIVVDLINTFAAGKGFTTNNVQTGNFNVPSIKFNYQQLTKALEALAKLIGWEWYVDADKDVHFFVQEPSLAPVALDDVSGQINWPTLKIDVNLQNLKNSVFVLGGTYQKTFTSANAVDVYETDGVKQVFSLAYRYDKDSIEVTLDGAPLTVGIDQQADPSTVQVLYNPDGRFVRFTGGAEPAGQTLRVFGDASIPIVAHAKDAASIAEHGEYQDVIVDRQITSVPQAQQRAKAEILQFGRPLYDVTFETLTPGCRLGQTVLLNSDAFGVTNLPLTIKRIEARVLVPGEEARLTYRIQALGADNVTFVDIMATLLQQQNAVVIDDATVLQVLVETVPEETVNLADAIPEPVSQSPPYTWA
jgi:hypothetical protein